MFSIFKWTAVAILIGFTKSVAQNLRETFCVKPCSLTNLLLRASVRMNDFHTEAKFSITSRVTKRGKCAQGLQLTLPYNLPSKARSSLIRILDSLTILLECKKS